MQSLPISFRQGGRRDETTLSRPFSHSTVRNHFYQYQHVEESVRSRWNDWRRYQREGVMFIPHCECRVTPPCSGKHALNASLPEAVLLGPTGRPAADLKQLISTRTCLETRAWCSYVIPVSYASPGDGGDVRFGLLTSTRVVTLHHPLCYTLPHSLHPPSTALTYLVAFRILS